ncbi:uncharacterized protein J3R85_014097 [Psidium guajava]|nr:uncharacterized protein J3R85_014097 [Psidium guajava]
MVKSDFPGIQDVSGHVSMPFSAEDDNRSWIVKSFGA